MEFCYQACPDALHGRVLKLFRPRFLKFLVHAYHQSISVCLGWGLRFGIFHVLSDDVNVSGMDQPLSLSILDDILDAYSVANRNP